MLDCDFIFIIKIMMMMNECERVQTLRTIFIRETHPLIMLMADENLCCSFAS